MQGHQECPFWHKLLFKNIYVEQESLQRMGADQGWGVVSPKENKNWPAYAIEFGLGLTERPLGDFAIRELNRNLASRLDAQSSKHRGGYHGEMRTGINHAIKGLADALRTD
jgi:hypothetical protein